MSEPSPIDDYPQEIEAPYLNCPTGDFPNWNSPIVLHSGPITLKIQSNEFDVSGEIRMDWYPIPNLYFRLVFPGFCDFCGPAKLVLGNRNVEVDAFISFFHTQAFGESGDGTATEQSVQPTTTLEGVAYPTEIKSTDRLNCITFLLPNFLTCTGHDMIRSSDSTHLWGGRLQYCFGEWEIIVDCRWGCAGDFLKRLADTGTYAITHVGRISKKDGTEFGLDEAACVLEMLNSLLSFCNGRRTAILLPVGSNQAGETVWELWKAVDVDRACNAPSWIPSNGRLWIQILEKVSAQFADRWKDLDARDTLRTAVDWYVTANSTPPRREKDAIIMIQAAIELLASAELVERKKVLNPATLKSIPAADKIRLLIDASKTPLGLPNGYDGLQKSCQTPGKPRWRDGPDAFTNIRNSIVHAAPDAKKTMRQNPDWQQWLWEARMLGLWYLERSILHYLDYEGWYLARGVIAPGYGPTEQWFPYGLPQGWTWASDIKPKT